MRKGSDSELNQASSGSDASDFSGGLTFSDRAKTRVKTKQIIGSESSNTGTLNKGN